MELAKATREVNNVALGFTLVGGAAAWFVHLAGMQAIHPLECARGSVSIMLVLTGVTTVVTLAAAFVGFRLRHVEASRETVQQRARFTARTGFALNLFFLFAIAAETLPLLYDDPCRGFDYTEEGRKARLFLEFLGLLPGLASAHSEVVPKPATAWRAFSFDPFVLAPLAFVLVGYLRGARRRRPSRRKSKSFALGMLALVVALISPLDALADALFSLHMAQHLVLTVVAAPLLAFSDIGSTLVRGLPSALRRPGGRLFSLLRRRAAWLRSPFVAASLHLVALWAWHVPVLYEAALSNPLLHTLEHASFLGTAMLLWSGVRRALGAYPLEASRMAFAIFGTATQNAILGALITLAPMPWYPSHAGGLEGWGRSPLEDQQLAGLLMWVPAAIVYLGAVLLLVSRFLDESDARMRRREARADAMEVVSER